MLRQTSGYIVVSGPAPKKHISPKGNSKYKNIKKKALCITRRASIKRGVRAVPLPCILFPILYLCLSVLYKTWLSQQEQFKTSAVGAAVTTMRRRSGAPSRRTKLYKEWPYTLESPSANCCSAATGGQQPSRRSPTNSYSMLSTTFRPHASSTKESSPQFGLISSQHTGIRFDTASPKTYGLYNSPSASLYRAEHFQIGDTVHTTAQYFGFYQTKSSKRSSTTISRANSSSTLVYNPSAYYDQLYGANYLQLPTLAIRFAHTAPQPRPPLSPNHSYLDGLPPRWEPHGPDTHEHTNSKQHTLHDSGAASYDKTRQHGFRGIKHKQVKGTVVILFPGGPSSTESSKRQKNDATRLEAAAVASRRRRPLPHREGSAGSLRDQSRSTRPGERAPETTICKMLWALMLSSLAVGFGVYWMPGLAEICCLASSKLWHRWYHGDVWDSRSPSGSDCLATCAGCLRCVDVFASVTSQTCADSSDTSSTGAGAESFTLTTCRGLETFGGTSKSTSCASATKPIMSWPDDSFGARSTIVNKSSASSTTADLPVQGAATHRRPNSGPKSLTPQPLQSGPDQGSDMWGKGKGDSGFGKGYNYGYGKGYGIAYGPNNDYANTGGNGRNEALTSSLYQARETIRAMEEENRQRKQKEEMAELKADIKKECLAIMDKPGQALEDSMLAAIAAGPAPDPKTSTSQPSSSSAGSSFTNSVVNLIRRLSGAKKAAESKQDPDRRHKESEKAKKKKRSEGPHHARRLRRSTTARRSPTRPATKRKRKNHEPTAAKLENEHRRKAKTVRTGAAAPRKTARIGAAATPATADVDVTNERPTRKRVPRRPEFCEDSVFDVQFPVRGKTFALVS